MLRLMMATKKQIIEKQRLRYQKARKKDETHSDFRHVTGVINGIVP